MTEAKENLNRLSDEELMKRAEISLRNAPMNTGIKVVPPLIRDGKVYHPNLTERGELKKAGK